MKGKCIRNEIHGWMQKYFHWLQLLLIVSWITNLRTTDAYFSVYALCCAGMIASLWDNHKSQNKITGVAFWLGAVLAALLSLACVLANYSIFQQVRNPYEVSSDTNTIMNWINCACTYMGGLFGFFEIIRWSASRFPILFSRNESRNKPGLVFAVVFASIAIIDLLYLFFVCYPGSVTSDSVWQIYQVVEGGYTNHHPYWHTQLIGALMKFGYALFGTANAAAATYSAGQILIMAACFAYAQVTLYQLVIPKWMQMVSFVMYAFLPHHFIYSATMWKDVLFGGCMLLVVTALLRVIRNVGKWHWLNYAVLIIGGIGAGVLRSNGWYAIVATFVLLLLLLREQRKKLLIPCLIVVLGGWLLMNPIPKMLNVTDINYVEGLSVPIQQVSRVIANGGELTEEEAALLEIVVNVDDIPELYTQWVSDPIKDVIRTKNYSYFQEHTDAYVKLWLQLGLRYPQEYLEAWIELTKGFWNGGYDYYIYAEYVSENDWGIYMEPQNNIIFKLVKAYCTFTRLAFFFEPIQSIGLHVWLTGLMLYINFVHKRREFMLALPILLVVCTLWVATPVFCEFRYAYCVFTAFPLLLSVTMFKPMDEE